MGCQYPKSLIEVRNSKQSFSSSTYYHQEDEDEDDDDDDDSSSSSDEEEENEEEDRDYAGRRSRRSRKQNQRQEDGLTFLDMIVRQIEFLNTKHGIDIPLVLLNSYKTHEGTMKKARKYATRNITIHMVLQNCYPRISKETMLPLPSEPFSPETEELWYPPGHGDIYYSLFHSQLLEELIQQGKEYLFISNIDNLGAEVDPAFPFYMAEQNVSFLASVLPRKRGILSSQDNYGHPSKQKGGFIVGVRQNEMVDDKKKKSKKSKKKKRKGEEESGGEEKTELSESTSVEGGDGSPSPVVEEENPIDHCLLLERSQVPFSQLSSMQSFNFFNTNNLYENIRSLNEKIIKGSLQEDVVGMERQVTLPTNSSRTSSSASSSSSSASSSSSSDVRTVTAIQLETLAGSIIRQFKKPKLITVPQSHYLSVRSTSDLFLLQSDLFYSQHGTLSINPKRLHSDLPLVKLGLGFQTLEEYNRRFPRGLPSILHLEQLTVSGDVIFGADVTLRGSVVIVASENATLMIPDGARFEDQIVSGHLTVLDH